MPALSGHLTKMAQYQCDNSNDQQARRPSLIPLCVGQTDEWSLIAKGPMIAFPTALKIYTAVTTIEAQAMIVAIR